MRDWHHVGVLPIPLGRLGLDLVLTLLLDAARLGASEAASLDHATVQASGAAQVTLRPQVGISQHRHEDDEETHLPAVAQDEHRLMRRSSSSVVDHKHSSHDDEGRTRRFASALEGRSAFEQAPAPSASSDGTIEKAVKLCDWGPGQVGSYDASAKTLVERLQASSATLCQEACCADVRCAAFVYRKASEECQLLNSQLDTGSFAADSQAVSAIKAGAVDQAVTGKESTVVEVTIGASDLVQKCVKAPTKVVCQEDSASTEQRLNKDIDELAFSQTFSITVSNGRQVCAQRTDKSEGWKQQLKIQCKQADLILDGGDGTYSDIVAESSGGARIFALRIDAGQQDGIVLCEVKLFNEEMENIAPKAAVQLMEKVADSHISLPEHSQADLLVDHAFYVPGDSEMEDMCLTWKKDVAAKLLVRFEFSSKQIITAGRLYTTHKQFFGERAELLASRHDPGSEWKAILSTVPTQGLTIQFDGEPGTPLLPEGGNPACPNCMQNEGFPASPLTPPVRKNKTRVKLPGPPGPLGERGPPGRKPALKNALSPKLVNLILWAGALNLFITGCLYVYFRKGLHQKYHWWNDASWQEEWK